MGGGSSNPISALVIRTSGCSESVSNMHGWGVSQRLVKILCTTCEAPFFWFSSFWYLSVFLSVLTDTQGSDCSVQKDGRVYISILAPPGLVVTITGFSLILYYILLLFWKVCVSVFINRDSHLSSICICILFVLIFFN